MDNMDIALRATTTALGAQGSAVKENATYMEGLEGRLDSLKAQVEKFWTSTSTQEFLSGLINTLADFMKMINQVGQHLDILKTAITLLGVAFVIFKSQAIAGVLVALGQFVVALFSSTTAVGGLTAALMTLMATPMGALAAVIGAIAVSVGGLIIMTDYMSRSDKAAAAAKEELRLEAEKQLETNQKQIDIMRDEIKNTEDLLKQYDELKNKSGKTIADKERLSELEAAILKNMPGLIDYYDAEGKAHLNNTDNIKTEIAMKKELALANQKLLTDDYIKKADAIRQQQKSIPDKKKELNEKLATYKNLPVEYDSSRERFLTVEGSEWHQTLGGIDASLGTNFSKSKNRNELIQETQKELSKLEQQEKQNAISLADLNQYIAKGTDAYQQFSPAVRNIADELFKAIPKDKQGSEYEAAIIAITEKMRNLGLEAKLVSFNKLNQEYSKGKATLGQLNNSYDELFDTFNKLGLGELFDKFVQVNNKELDFLTTTEEVNKSVTSLSNEVKDYNGVLDTLEKKEKVAQETLVELMQKYPEFAKEIHLVNGKLVIEHDALVALKKARIDDGLEGIKQQMNLTDAVKRELERRLHNYGIEAKALETQAGRIKALTNAKNEYNKVTTVTVNGTTGKMTTSAPSGLGERNPEVMDMNQVIGDLQEYANASDYIEKLKGALLSSNPYYGITPPKDEKGDKDKHVTAKYTNEKLAEIDRYMELNLALERTNTLIAQNKALQENATIQDKIKLMKTEIDLYAIKQKNLHAIAAEERVERKELVDWLSINAKATFKGEGDTLSITNSPAILEKKMKEVNAWRNKTSDKDVEYYKKISQEYTILQAKVARFNELQVKGIPDMQQQWMGVLKVIRDTTEAMRKLKIELMFMPVNKDIEQYKDSLQQIGFDEALAGDNTVKLAKVKAEKVQLLTNSVIMLTSYLNDMNNVTDKAILADEDFIKSKRNLKNAVQEATTSLITLTTEMEDERKTSVEDTEKRIIEIIKKGVELRKKHLQDDLDNYKDYVDEFLAEKERQYESVDYEKELQKEVQTRQQIQAQIDALSMDSSIEAFQKVRELKKTLGESDEKIADTRENRRRDVEKDNLEQTVTDKEKSTKEIIDLMDNFAYTEANIKQMAHTALINQSFDQIRKQFPELFKQLGKDAETGFFSVFESYELKFGETIIGYADRFEKEILPKLQQAVDTVNGIKEDMGYIDNKLKGVDYSKIVYDPNKDYQKDLNELANAGILPENDETAKELKLQKNAKMYADPTKYASQIALLPEDERKIESTQPNSGQAISKAITTVEADKITKPVSSPYNTKQMAIEIAKQEIGRLQSLWKGTKDTTKQEDYNRQANLIRAKEGLGLQNDKTNYIGYKSHIPQTELNKLGVKVLDGFSKGIDNGNVQSTGLYMLHGSPSKPEWVLTNTQLMNLVKNLSSGVNLPSTNGLQVSGTGSCGDISLNVNIAGNADKETVERLKDVGKGILLDIKKQMNKNGVFR
jgi:hypothetical protein